MSALSVRPPKVPCPACGSSSSQVRDSRPAVHQDGIRRKRICTACHRMFFTLELLDTTATYRRQQSK